MFIGHTRVVGEKNRFLCHKKGKQKAFPTLFYVVFFDYPWRYENVWIINLVGVELKVAL